MSPSSVAPGPIIAVALYAQALPALAYALTRRRSRPAAYMTIGGLFTVFAGLVGVSVGHRYGNNMVVGFISIPLIAGAYILALAEWQLTVVERLTMRIGLGLFIACYIVLVAFLEDVTHFGQFSHTLYSLVLLIAALWTLGRRSLAEDQALAIEADWFWVTFGIAIYGAATAASAAIGNILLARNRVDLFVRAWDVRGALVILGFLAIAWGVYRGPARNNQVTLGQ